MPPSIDAKAQLRPEDEYWQKLCIYKLHQFPVGVRDFVWHMPVVCHDLARLLKNEEAIADCRVRLGQIAERAMLNEFEVAWWIQLIEKLNRWKKRWSRLDE